MDYRTVSLAAIAGVLLATNVSAQTPTLQFELEAGPAWISRWAALPTEFEVRRTGNCLDHALWAWRKLGELGYEAELVVGRRLPWDPGDARHAWVLFEENGRRQLLETVEKRPDAFMVQAAAAAGDEYWPEFGVSVSGTRFAYGGYLEIMRAKLDAVWASRRESHPPTT